jgi:nitrate/nitrite-specific signal transduction histidine kinase
MPPDDRDLIEIELDPDGTIPGLVDEARHFFRQLIEANRSLKLKVASQDERLQQMAGEIGAARRHESRLFELEQENSRLTRELSSLRLRHEEIEVEHQDVTGRYQQIEEQYVMLANLYVASYQLHATLRYEDVLRVVKEILANLVGVKRMRLYLRTQGGDLLLVAGLDVPGEGTARLSLDAEPVIGKAMQSHESFYGPPTGDSPLAVVPLRIRKETVGVLVIDRLLAHKQELTSTDSQLFDLLGGHVAVAIFRSRRASRGLEPVASGIGTLADDQVDVNELLLVT